MTFLARSDRATPSAAQQRALDEVTEALHDAVLQRALGTAAEPAVAPLLRGRLVLRQHTVDLAVDAAVREDATTLLTHGWRPRELLRFAQRRLDPLATAYAVDALAATAQWATSVGWSAELAEIDAHVWWSIGQPHVSQWAQRHRRLRGDAVRVAVDVLALLRYLPRTDEPRASAPATPPVAAGAAIADERVVGRIDALLARARSTDYAAEAEACTAKAYDLLTRHSPVRA